MALVNDIVSGSGENGSGSPSGAAGGDLGGTYPNPTVVSVAHVTTGTLPAGNQAAQTLTGDVVGTTAANTLTLAGDVTGRAGTTVVGKIQGNTVTSGALTEGNLLIASSTSNWASTTVSGDVAFSASSPGATTVLSITGASGTINVASTGNVITWAAATTAPGLKQTAAVSGAGANLTIAPQAATTSGASGSLLVNLAVPASGTTEAYLQVQRAGSTLLQMGALIGTLTSGAIYPPGVTPGSTNYALAASNISTFFNGATNLLFAIGGTTFIRSNSGHITLFNPNSDISGSGTNTLGIANATVVPTVLVSSGTGLALYSNAGNLEIDGQGFGFNNLVPTPSIYQTAPLSGVTPVNMVIAPQGPNAGSSTTASGTPGSLNLTLAAPVSTGLDAAVNVVRGANTIFSLQTLVGTTTASALYMSNSTGSSFAPTASNYTIATNGSSTTFSAPAHANLVGGTTTLSVFGGGYFFLGGSIGTSGVGVITIGAATTNPTAGAASSANIYTEKTTFHLKALGALSAFTTLAPAGSAQTINSQRQIYDQQCGTAETISSATPTTILAYTTISNSGGLITITLVSRATTAGTGVAAQDTATATYVLGFKNTAGTVALSSLGLTLVGSVQTTATALTSVLTTSIATNVITFLVTNVNLCTIDSEVWAEIIVN